MSFSVQKYNGQLICSTSPGFQTRNQSTIWCIQQANDIYNWKDFPQIIIHTGDFENNSLQYTYSKQHPQLQRLVPDFNFCHWREAGINDYNEIIQQIEEAGRSPPIIQKAGWIGNIHSNYFRRYPLYTLGQLHPNVLDIMEMTWNPRPSNYISLPDLVKKYSILIDIEGQGYSGRLKYLLWSHRPVLLVDRPHQEYFFPYLEKWVHYIPVERDLSDLVEKTLWCINNMEKAKEIAENAYAFSKIHLTREACYEQWNRIIQSV
jgi:hypothetical protein